MAQKQIAPTTQIIKIPIKAESMESPRKMMSSLIDAARSDFGGSRSPAGQPITSDFIGSVATATRYA
jgi:hypothetical protein